MEGGLSQIDPYVTDVEFKDAKRCFKACIKDTRSPHLELDERTCSENCLSKYLQARLFLGQKLQHEFMKAIQSDPRMRGKVGGAGH